ncbi:uncharacterized protein DS421_17g594510 [Arachis hypogaea]|nr:uncharacterized protein DS421_17g594510 [Arachis hypogaea]
MSYLGSTDLSPSNPNHTQCFTDYVAPLALPRSVDSSRDARFRVLPPRLLLATPVPFHPTLIMRDVPYNTSPFHGP